jgi:glycosyltransferase involved in cell wall biosynthesis
MNNITFVIFTYNEERRIERVIKNVKDFGKILIADNKSTDKTVQIAKSYGCDILTREKNYEFLEDQDLLELIYKNITTDWLFWIYSDEMFDKKTLEKIIAIISSEKYNILKIDRKNYFYGEFLNDSYHSANNRIFTKGAINFTNNIIHGFGTPTVAKERIYTLPRQYFIHQFIDYTAASYLNAVNRYTEIELRYPNSPKKSIWYLLFRITKNLIRNYFLSGGYRAGFPGLALTELTLYYELVKNIKVFEQVNNLDKKAIEDKNDVQRDFILKQLER